MYGPPRDCKVEFGRETSLRQCIRPFVESRAPGQDEFRCVSVLTMYGPPRDCKVEFGRETSLRQCMVRRVTARLSLVERQVCGNVWSAA